MFPTQDPGYWATGQVFGVPVRFDKPDQGYKFCEENRSFDVSSSRPAAGGGKCLKMLEDSTEADFGNGVVGKDVAAVVSVCVASR